MLHLIPYLILSVWLSTAGSAKTNKQNCSASDMGSCYCDETIAYSEGTIVPVIGDCRQYCIYSNSEFTKFICLLARNYDSIKQQCTKNQSACQNTPQGPILCENGQKKIFHSGDCKDYWRCDGGNWVKESCSWGYDFDMDKLSCVWSWWAKC